MTTPQDEQLLNSFFQAARQQEIADDGFSDRVMQRLPATQQLHPVNSRRALRLSRIWTCGCWLLALGYSATASAGVKNATTLCIEDKTGGVLKFYLSERPKIIFKGNYTIVQTGETKLLQFRNLRKAYFTDEEDPTGLENSEQRIGNNAQWSMVNGQWSMDNFPPLTTVLVYTPGGTLVSKAQTNTQGSATISLGSLPSGVYIIKAGKMKFKIAK